MNKKYYLVILSFLLIITNISALPLSDFEITVNIFSPSSSKVTENWVVNYQTPEELTEFKERILKSSTDLTELQKINPDIKPHIYINQDKIKNRKISFDEVNAILRIEYDLEDHSLIKYLDYQEQIFWRFNENLFNQFVVNGLFSIPKSSKIVIELYNPLIIGDVSPQTNQTENTITWSGVSTNELKIIAIEKKPPKPTFVVSNIFSKDFLNKSYFNILYVFLVIVLILLIFRNKVSSGIKKFITKHSVIKPRKQINEIVDFDFVNKK